MSKQGFASMKPEKLRAVSSKGGSAKVPKGFALLSLEERRANALRASKVRWSKVREERLRNKEKED